MLATKLCDKLLEYNKTECIPCKFKTSNFDVAKL